MTRPQAVVSNGNPIGKAKSISMRWRRCGALNVLGRVYRKFLIYDDEEILQIQSGGLEANTADAVRVPERKQYAFFAFLYHQRSRTDFPPCKIRKS